MRSVNLLVSMLLLFSFTVLAQESGTATEEDTKVKLTPYGYIDFELGQIVSGRCRDKYAWDTTYAHTWLQNMHGRLGLKYTPFDWLDIRTGFEVRMYFNTFPIAATFGENDPRPKYWTIYLHEAQGKFKLIDKENILMDMAIGYFPYKYNPEVCNLGEYLFRTGTYPTYIINYYDLPLARLAGLRYTVGYKNDLLGMNLDLLGLTEMEMWPYHDFTLATILDFDIFKNENKKNSILAIGAGLSFAHLIPVDEKITTPKHKSNPERSLYKVDTTGGKADSSFYTFKGTKLMLRTTLDPFAFIRCREGFAADFFGKYGGKLYGELAIIGFKNYPSNAKHKIFNGTDTVEVGFADSSQGNPFGYNSIKERMPIMFGFTIPCWKILDIFALEFEYFNSPYPNDYERVYRDRLPITGELKIHSANSDYTYDFYKKENKWKWSLFMKKTIKDHFGLILQVGRDHQRWEFNGHKDNWDFEEIMVKNDQWAWNFKTEFKF